MFDDRIGNNQGCCLLQHMLCRDEFMEILFDKSLSLCMLIGIVPISVTNNNLDGSNDVSGREGLSLEAAS